MKLLSNLKVLAGISIPVISLIAVLFFIIGRKNTKIDTLEIQATQLEDHISLQQKQLADLQELVLSVTQKSKADSVNFNTREKQFQNTISQQQRLIKNLKTGVQIDLVKLRYNMWGNVKDSTYHVAWKYGTP